MARYTGPRLRKARALGCELPGLTGKSWERRPFPPGQHGQSRRGKPSDFKLRLQEKQKLRFNYGLSEKQLIRLFEEAKKFKGVTGDKILELLERRLDNTVFRAGFASSIPAARQLLTHGHLLLNGHKVTAPSLRVRPGDTLTFRERSRSLKCVGESLDRLRLPCPEWIELEVDARKAQVKALPTPVSVPLEVNIQLVVEFYAK